MKVIIFLALVASATAIPFLDRLNRVAAHAPMDEVIEDVETTTVDFSPAKLVEMIARRRQQLANENIETTTVEFSPYVEDMGAPEHMSWPVAVEEEEVIEDIETTTIDFSPAKVLEMIARRRQAVEKMETTTIDFAPWEVVETTTIDFAPWEDMKLPEHNPLDARREELRARLNELVHRRA